MLRFMALATTWAGLVSRCVDPHTERNHEGIVTPVMLGRADLLAPVRAHAFRSLCVFAPGSQPNAVNKLALYHQLAVAR